jgi:PAS domain S-box-containing protein
LEDFFNLVPDLVCVASTDGYFKRLNPAWEAALGYSPAQLLAEPIESFLHPEDIAPTRAEVARPLQGQTTVPFRNRYRAKDGTYHWLEWQAAPAAGGLLYAAARDITERKQAEEALRIREEIFSSIVIQAADGILLIDGATGRFVEFNTAAHEDLGYTREQFARLTLADLQTELADERIQEDFRRSGSRAGSSSRRGIGAATASCATCA